MGGSINDEEVQTYFCDRNGFFWRRPCKDSAAYGDDGADTMGHIAEKHDNWKIPNLTRLGLANLHPLKGVTPAEHPLGYQLVLNEKAVVKIP